MTTFEYNDGEETVGIWLEEDNSISLHMCCPDCCTCAYLSIPPTQTKLMYEALKKIYESA